MLNGVLPSGCPAGCIGGSWGSGWKCSKYVYFGIDRVPSPMPVVFGSRVDFKERDPSVPSYSVIVKICRFGVFW